MQRVVRRPRPEAKADYPDGSSYPSRDSKPDKKDKRFGTFTCLAFALTVGAICFTMLDNLPGSRQTSPTLQVITGASKSDSAVSTESVIVKCVVSTVNWKSDDAANGVLNVIVDKKAPEAELFLYLVEEGYYDGTYFFRVIKDFVAQFGFHPDKEMVTWKSRIDIKRKEYSSQNVDTKNLHNDKGTLTMIRGPIPQMFINLGDNRRLDKDGTLPVGFVDEESMKLAEKIYAGYKPGLGQIPSINNGTVSGLFPRMSKIEKCYLRK